MRDTERDWFRWNYDIQQHHRRYVSYVETHGLVCQECGGSGGRLSWGYTPPEECGFCEGTGKVTRWMRGQWLRWKKEDKKSKAQGHMSKSSHNASSPVITDAIDNGSVITAYSGHGNEVQSLRGADDGQNHQEVLRQQVPKGSVGD